MARAGEGGAPLPQMRPSVSPKKRPICCAEALPRTRSAAAQPAWLPALAAGSPLAALAGSPTPTPGVRTRGPPDTTPRRGEPFSTRLRAVYREPARLLPGEVSADLLARLAVPVESPHPIAAVIDAGDEATVFRGVGWGERGDSNPRPSGRPPYRKSLVTAARWRTRGRTMGCSELAWQEVAPEWPQRSGEGSRQTPLHNSPLWAFPEGLVRRTLPADLATRPGGSARCSSASRGPRRMIESFRYIQNVGRFRRVQDPRPLGRMTLIYAENGRGKTTLSAIIRSLASNDPRPILERRRLSETDPARVVVEFDGISSKFDGTGWTNPGPRVLVFDEHFVDANVCSGLEVEASHRQNLHELVIGEEGVRFLRRVQGLTDEVDQAQRGVREKQQAIPGEARGSLSVDAFCSLPQLDDLDEQLADAERSLSVLRNAETVRAARDFSVIALPTFDQASLRSLFAATLENVDQAALNAVNAHFGLLGVGAEAWVSRGVAYAGTSPDCPFCGQRLVSRPGNSLT